MTDPKLTDLRVAGTDTGTICRGRWMNGLIIKAGMASFTALALTGCINVSAPEEPIVIELNVNIRAEVLYRLAEDANNTIDENADIF